MTRADGPIPTPFAQRVTDFRQRRVPVLVWVVAAAICAWMIGGRASRFEYIGLAQANVYEISAEVDARIEAVLVEPLDDVRSGDVVVALDDSRVAAELQTAQASVRQVQAQLDAARIEVVGSRSRDEVDWAADLRRFQLNEEQRRLETLELKIQVEGDRIEQERLRVELARAETLLGSGLLSQSEFEITRLSHDELAERLANNLVLLSQLEQEYRSAKTRREEFERQLPVRPGDESLLEPLRAAIDTEMHRVKEIELARAALVLRAPVDGQVTAIYARRWQSVVPGEPIATITERSVREIVTYLRDGDDRRVEASTPVLVSSRARPGKVGESVVLRVGESVEELPPRLWRDPTVPDYGRPVVIAGVPGLALVPGETLDVRFRGSR